MIPVRYTLVRWIILVIGAAITASYFFLRLSVGLQFFLGFLLVLTATSWIIPPGIYGWLVQGVCPTCGKSVEWAAVNPKDKPYQEQIVVRCPGCGKSKIEWQYLHG